MRYRPAVLVPLTLCLLAAAPALAQSERRTPLVTSQAPHGYWLSTGLNRLVFWKRPDTSRVTSVTRMSE